ncbi:MAG: ParB/RepB/Spo0J family partition protein [Clostridia bacterium]|nr:ParB/RepB/Spo0J family partition protein [Clostridia bacterium]
MKGRDLMHTIGEKRIRMLNPREIKKPSATIRTDFKENELQLLRDSISASGVLQPILVRKIKKGKYELISGGRRLNASLMAGLRRVPCVVHNADDNTALLYSLTENLQSSRLSFFDEARAINRLISAKGMSLSTVASHLGVSQTTLFSKLQLLRLEERLINRITEADLTEDHARALLRLPKEGRAEALNTIIDQKLSVGQAEDYIFKILNPPFKCEEKPQEKSNKKGVITDPRIFSNSLTKLIDTLKSSGIKVNFKKSESEKYTEYKIRIKKEATDKAEPLQLKLCQ